MSKYYLTTPIYYVNASPHIGHAYTTVISDCIARYRRALGDEVFFLTGTDEHGEKIKKAAEKAGKEVLAFVDDVSQNFKRLWEALSISHDFFIRTTSPRHEEAVKRAVAILYEKGDIYKAKYRSYYCVPCEAFWTDTQVKEHAGSCPDCNRPVEEIEEENYFFKLSKYEGWLKDYLQHHPGFVQPQVRYNEVMGFLANNKLEDLCISRPKKRVSWGIDVPFDDSYVVYVWFDALLNYITGVGCYFEPETFTRWWPADVHFMAKDIILYHAVYWPILLKALDIELPRAVFAHGWWKFEGEKMSKSRGNIVNPFDLIDDLSAAFAGARLSAVDALRYFLLREVTLGLDGSFSWEALVHRTNSDLANDLGNLVFRTLNMTEKYFQATVSGAAAAPKAMADALNALVAQYGPAMNAFNVSGALTHVFNLVSVMNKYVEETKPWTLFKENRQEELKNFLWSLLEGIRIVSFYIYPAMPNVAAAIQRQLGVAPSFALSDALWSKERTFAIKKETPLFPRIDAD